MSTIIKQDNVSTYRKQPQDLVIIKKKYEQI
jgi:hypothetical protein